MRIKIEGAKNAPKWETLQSMIRESINDDAGKLVRIARTDNGCDYHGCGEYDLDFRTATYDIIPVRVVVSN